MTELIQNGIKRIGDGDIDDDDDFVDEVGGCQGVTISIIDESTTNQGTKFNISITDKDYLTKPKPAVAKKGTSNKQPSEQHNVPKLSNLPSSFSKSGFFNAATTVASKLKEDEIQTVADTDRPIIPISREMKDGRDKLAALKQELLNYIQILTSSYVDVEGGTWEDHAERIKEVGQYLNDVAEDLKRCDEYITAVQKQINVVESVRKRANLFMDAALNLNGVSSYVKWAGLLGKTNMILRLVDNEKNKMEEASALPTVDQAETASDDDEVQIIEPRTTTDGEVDVESTAASDSITTSTINLPKAANGERKGRTTKTAAATQPVRDEKEKRDFISFDKFVRQLNGGARNKHSSCQGHSLEWQDGKVFCKACGHTRITQLKNMHRHIKSTSHIEKLAQAQSRHRVARCLSIKMASNLLTHMPWELTKIRPLLRTE